MEIAELENIWEDFSLVNLENRIIKYPFHNWKEGTEITNILDWFYYNIPNLFYDYKFSVYILEVLWEEFGDIPINNDDEIELDFYCWEKGTYRFEIWHWFDEKLPNGLAIDFNV